MESDEDSDAPDSIVPASSPESQLGDETTRFPHLLGPKEEEDERAISPVIPIIPRSAIPSMWYHLEIILICLLETLMTDRLADLTHVQVLQRQNHLSQWMEKL